MNKQEGAQLNNKGYSLVELIVVVLLMSVIMGMVAMFISFSRNAYQMASKEATLQTESEVAKSFIRELAVEAFDVGSFSFSTTGGASYDGKGIWLLTPDNEYMGLNKDDSDNIIPMSFRYYFVLLEKNNEVLRYCSVPKGDSRLGSDFGTEGFDYSTFDFEKLFSDDASSGVDVYEDPYALLAEHVTDISFIRNNGLISIGLKLNLSDTSYNTTMNISGRNLIN